MATINSATSDPEALTEIGSRLRLYRVNQELTAEELARRAGVTPLTLLKAERGENFTLRTLLRILRALGRMDLMESFLPPPAPSPLSLLEGGVVAPRKRVRKKRPGG
jgi:transcriptional regulator with XRE-family HTH domain